MLNIVEITTTMLQSQVSRGWQTRRCLCRSVKLTLACYLIMSTAQASPEEPLTSFFDQEIARFTELAESGVEELQIEAAQGFYYLEHHLGEEVLLPLAEHDSPAVRLHAVKALGFCGGRSSIRPLIDILSDEDWEVRTHAVDALQRMTAAGPFTDGRKWAVWYDGSNWEEKEAALITQLADADKSRATAALQALRYVGSSAAEDTVLRIGPRLGREGILLIVKALERTGTEKSRAPLISLSPGIPSASWALAEIGGEGVEDALLAGLARWRENRLDYMINLDRIGSARCWEQMPILLRAFGLVIYRSRTDDLQFSPTAYQRAAANLILRTGRSQEVVDLVLSECENTRLEEKTPPLLRKPLAEIKAELAPGFVRNDGATVAQPLAALPHIIRDRRFTARLIALLDHPAYIVRIYAAECLAALKAAEGVAPILKVVRAPYPFPDPTSQVSGKHFERSKFVRWRGYVCIALGKLGNEEARIGLEQLALNPASYRDVRYGSVVGLRFLASSKSIPTLAKVAEEDIIREIRLEAKRGLEEIAVKQRLSALLPADDVAENAQ